MIGLDFMDVLVKSVCRTVSFYFIFCHTICNFNFFFNSLPCQDLEFHIHWIYMKIALSEVVVCVFVLRPLLFPSRGNWPQV